MKNYFVYLIILSFLVSCSREVNEGTGPHADKMYVIDNAAFGISSNKTNARETTDGINQAIEQAKAEGYTCVKLKPGNYLIRCSGATGYENWDGLFMPNNITLDLTDVKLYVEPNNASIYKIFRIDQVENVTIQGGHLIGDRGEAVSHKSGSGVEINCSRNITIDGMKIENIQGVAVWIGYGFIAPNERRLNKNIKILNCELHDCSMLGVGIIHASGVEIAYNTIYNISGMEPECGIDIEPEADWSGSRPWKSWVEYVNIHHNVFRDTKAEGLCIVNDYSTDIEAADNTFENSAVVVNRNPKRIRFVRNTLKGWASYMVARTSEDVYMPLEGPDKNNPEFSERVTNCSTQTGYITETDNYTKCD